MQQELTTAVKSRAVARPLRVLAKLINEDVVAGVVAADTAGMPHYRAAGHKLIEARSNPKFKDGGFKGWVKKYCEVSYPTANRYITLVELEEKNGLVYETMNEAMVAAGRASEAGSTTRPQPWHKPIKDVLNTIDIDTLVQAQLEKAKEEKAQTKLASQLIDIGYKALATTLHPDKVGGSHEPMARLNNVRERLRKCL